MELDRVQRLIKDKLTAARDGQKRNVLLAMARLAGGYAAGGCGTVADWRNLLTETVKSLKWDNLKKCAGHIDDGLSYGQEQPIKPGKQRTRNRPATPRPRAWRPIGSDTLSPVTPTARYPLTMTIPATEAQWPGLALPAGKWQRPGDGSITTTFTSAWELQTCLDATRACRGDNGNL